ncbi:MAG: thymidine kinase [Myxococcota bacterium]
MAAGHIEVICGPMFSGKTEELIRRLRRAQIARQRVVVFKPKIDDRYHESDIVSHSSQRLESIPIEHASEIEPVVRRLEPQVIGVDEAQFFRGDLVEVCERLADAGIRVLAAGLDLDYRGQPFGPIPRLLAVAEFITKQLAVCMVCGAPAARSQRVSWALGAASEEQVLVGATEAYEARCRRCFVHDVDVPSAPRP